MTAATPLYKIGAPSSARWRCSRARRRPPDRPPGQRAPASESFSRRWVTRGFDSPFLTAIAYAAGSPTMKTFHGARG